MQFKQIEELKVGMYIVDTYGGLPIRLRQIPNKEILEHFNTKPDKYNYVTLKPEYMQYAMSDDIQYLVLHNHEVSQVQKDIDKLEKQMKLDAKGY